jgi:hypothetical protein
MKRNLCNIIIIFAAVLLASCSSMYGDTFPIVNIEQAKPNTQIYINGAPSAFRTSDTGATVISIPTTWGDTNVQVGKYGSSQMVLTEFDSMGILNILNFPLGTIVDAATGNIMMISAESRILNFGYNKDSDSLGIMDI